MASFPDVLGSWATLTPRRTALTWLEDGESLAHELTYEALDKRAREISVGIRTHLEPGDRALLLHPPGLEFVTAFFGCLYGGVVPVPVYPPRNQRHFPRIEAILDDAGARCVLTDTTFVARVTAWLEHRGEKLPVISSDQLRGNAEKYEACLDANPDALAFLQYTSGSTGQPKGVMVTHDNLMSNQRMIQTAMGHSEGLVEASWLPVYHDMGLIGNLMQPLFLGGRCVFMSPAAFLQKPVRWLEAITRFRADGSGAPNFAYKLCVRSVTEEQKAKLDLSSLKVLYSGSEPIDAKILDEFAETFRETGLRREALYPCYGMAETTLLATGAISGNGPVYETVDANALALNVALPRDPDSQNTRVVVGCGRTVAGQELRIVDPENTAAPLEDGRIGEIWIRGAHVAAGYWGKPELTKETFSARLGDDGPFLRTGDLGYMRRGELFVTGRIKDLIIVRGRNHYPQDIESTIERSHQALALSGSAAFSVEEEGEERLVIVSEIQRSMLRSVNPDDVFASVRQAVFEQHDLSVHAIVLIRPATLPRTSSGKVQRRACRAAYLANELDSVAILRERPATVQVAGVAIEAPDTAADIERWLQKWIAARLNLEPSAVDPERAFADLGLDSVSGVALTTALSEWLGREVSPTLVWDYPTIRLAAEYFAPSIAEPPDSGSVDEAAELLMLELASLRAEGQG